VPCLPNFPQASPLGYLVRLCAWCTVDAPLVPRHSLMRKPFQYHAFSRIPFPYHPWLRHTIQKVSHSNKKQTLRRVSAVFLLFKYDRPNNVFKKYKNHKNNLKHLVIPPNLSMIFEDEPRPGVRVLVIFSEFLARVTTQNTPHLSEDRLAHKYPV